MSTRHLECEHFASCFFTSTVERFYRHLSSLDHSYRYQQNAIDSSKANIFEADKHRIGKELNTLSFFCIPFQKRKRQSISKSTRIYRSAACLFPTPALFLKRPFCSFDKSFIFFVLESFYEAISTTNSLYAQFCSPIKTPIVLVSETNLQILLLETIHCVIQLLTTRETAVVKHSSKLPNTTFLPAQ